MAISDRLLQRVTDNQGIQRFPEQGLKNAADELESRIGLQGDWDASAGSFPGSGTAR